MQKLNYPTPQGAGDRKSIGQTPGAAAGCVIADAAQRFDGFTLVIANDTNRANQLNDEINFFSDNAEIMAFPDWETLPYDAFSPHQDIISERITTLNKLPRVKKGILIVPLSTLMHRTAPADFIAANCFDLKVEDTINVDKLRSQLTDAGYHAVETVLEHGEYAIRGSIIDLFPTGSDLPYRIELFDDEIETLRTFDPETQRSISQIDAINLLPAKEFPFDSRAISGFKARWRERFDVDYRRCPVYTNISDGMTSPGIEYYLPLFLKSAARYLQRCQKIPRCLSMKNSSTQPSSSATK